MEKRKKNDFYYESDYYFECTEIGKIYRIFTDHILACDVKLNNKISDTTSDFVKDSGYNPMILVFYDENRIKFNWNLQGGITDFSEYSYEPPLTIEQKRHIANFFCCGDWEEEMNYHQTESIITNEHMKWSDNFGEIIHNTLPWVEYLTFQNSRIILQFNLEKTETFIKQLIREKKLKRIIKDE